MFHCVSFRKAKYNLGFSGDATHTNWLQEAMGLKLLQFSTHYFRLATTKNCESFSGSDFFSDASLLYSYSTCVRVCRGSELFPLATRYESRTSKVEKFVNLFNKMQYPDIRKLAFNFYTLFWLVNRS